METWKDQKTGLEWQVDPAAETMTWAEAKKYAAGLDPDGGGWRLPTKDELVGISGKNRPKELGGNGWYWSSSPVEDIGIYAWYVNFNYGDVGYNYDVDYDTHVRCVR